ncbi:MAG: phosphoenolpyruvate-protein phosphotransferase [Bacilli bacterium]|nr:phosphoenolpyruvate-protein phosphotransferase [Bacilli bacterium]
MAKGTGASPGIAIGKAFVLPAWEWDLSDEMVGVDDLALEFEKLYDGIRSSKDELQHIKKDIFNLIGEEESNIFDAHLAILEDPIFMNEVQGIMQRQFKVAEVAVKETIDKFVNMFELLDDSYMKERSADIRDVGNRLLKHLLGELDEPAPPANHPYILVSKELSPSQLAHLDNQQMLGIVTLQGGATSHAAIMARALEVPFVLGMEGKLEKPIVTGDLLIIDGEDGIVYVNPVQELVEEYIQRKKSLLAHREWLQEIVNVPPVTLDGQFMELKANISSLKELDLALKNGASGVGLFRTEFIYLDRTTLPKEEEQFEVYRQAAEKLQGKSLIIRTLDIGGDKSAGFISIPEEDNPSLGYRAIRISLDRRDIFKTQLKAILRASHYGSIKIMYPMISSIDEVRKANLVLDQAKKELIELQQPFDAEIEVGIMIEVPAAVIIADQLAEEVQFFSIGTNDLTQYVLAVDRMNETIAHLYDPYHPAIIRMLKMTVDAAQRQGIPVSVCGELAGDVRAIPLWLDLGINELSMSVQSLLTFKNRFIHTRKSASKKLIEQAIACKTSEQIHLLLEQCRRLN